MKYLKPFDRNAAGAASADRRFYFGNSMLGVFLPGDELRSEKVEFSDIARGDIICFECGEKMIVHRVIAKTADHLTTMGDNNPRPDAFELHANLAYLRVIGFRRRGREFAARNGMSGRCQFQANRLRRRVRNSLRGIAVPLLALYLPVFGLRKLEMVKYADERHYFRRGRLIAVVRKDGRIMFRRWYYRLIFYLPKGAGAGER